MSLFTLNTSAIYLGTVMVYLYIISTHTHFVTPAKLPKDIVVACICPSVRLSVRGLMLDHEITLQGFQLETPY